MIGTTKRTKTPLANTHQVREDSFAQFSHEQNTSLIEEIEATGEEVGYMHPLEPSSEPMVRETESLPIEMRPLADPHILQTRGEETAQVERNQNIVNSEGKKKKPKEDDFYDQLSDHSSNKSEPTQENELTPGQENAEGNPVGTQQKTSSLSEEKNIASDASQILPEGESPAGGGGGEPSPYETPSSVEMDDSDSIRLLNSWSKCSPSSFLEKSNEVNDKMQAAHEKEKMGLEESLPVINQPTGLPAQIMPESGPGPAELATEKAPELTPEGEKVQIPIPEPVIVSNIPINNPPLPKGIDESSQEGEEDNWWNKISGKIQSYLSDIQTTDKTLPTSPGIAPIVPLEGESDPSQNVSHQEEGNASVVSEKSIADQTTSQDFGENDIYPQVEPVEMKPETELSDPPEIPSASTTDLGGIQPEAIAGFNEQAPPVIDDQISAELSKAEAEKGNFEQKSIDERTKADEQIKFETDKTRSEQEKAQSQSKKEIENYRDQWKSENEQVTDSYYKQSESKKKEIDTQIDSKIEEANTGVAKKYTEAEKETANKKREAEQEAERKKQAEQNKPKSVWQRIKGGISSAFNAIKNAVNKIFDGLRTVVKKIIEVAKKAAFALIDLAKNAIVGLIKAFGEALKTLVNIALAAFPELAEKFNNWIDQAVNFAADIVNQLAEALKSAVAALLNLLGATLDALLSLYQKFINIVLDSLHFLTVGLMEILEGISNLIVAAEEMPGNFWGQVSEEMLGVDITKPLPNEIPMPTKGIEPVTGMTVGDMGFKPAEKILDKKELSPEEVEVDEVPSGFELDPVLMDQVASMPEGANMEIDTASEGGPEKVDEIKLAALTGSQSREEEAQIPIATIPSVMHDQSGIHGAEQSVETNQAGMVGPFSGPGERLSYLAGQMKEGISKWWRDNKVAIIAGLVLGITGVILANILTGGAILAALPLLMQIIGALFLGAALANATSYFGSYLGQAFPGNILAGAVALARAAAIIVVELVSSLLFAGKGVVKGAKAAVKTVAKQGMKGAIKTGTKAAKSVGVRALKETGKAAKELGKVAVSGAKATVKNGKLVLGGITKGIGKGAKSFKSLAKSLAKKMKLKKIKIERKKFRFFILGEFNPWVLLATGEIKNVKIEGANTKVGETVKLAGTNQKGIVIGIMDKLPSNLKKKMSSLPKAKRAALYKKLSKFDNLEDLRSALLSSRATSQHAKELRSSMVKANQVAKAGDHAHHIIPSTHPLAKEAREILKKFKIGINNSNNGVFVNDAIHSTLHSHAYIQKVTSLLRGAKSKKAAIQALESIKNDVISGKFI